MSGIQVGKKRERDKMEPESDHSRSGGRREGEEERKKES